MCGFAGEVGWDHAFEPALVDVATLSSGLAPRGPDQEGVWRSERAVFVHRRLAILDLTGGVQPMVERVGDSAVVLIFAGEVYNHRELARQLESRGVRIRTRSDTEVVLRAYLEWGLSAIPKFDGMFAIAIWDERDKTLHLARDAVGVKPLYFAQSPAGLAFGSEPKSVLGFLGGAPVVDHDGLCELFGMWPYKSPGHAIFRDIKEVLPGTVLSFSQDGSQLRRYWQPAQRPHSDTYEETVDRTRELLRAAVGSQLESDYPMAAFLSGGLDSSAITAIAVQESASLTAFSLGYDNEEGLFAPSAFRPSLDDDWTLVAAEALGVPHHRIGIRWNDVVTALPEALKARDLPDTGDLDASLFLLADAVASSCKVALSGEGADEVFGGYPWTAGAIDTPWITFPWRRFLTFESRFVSPDLGLDLDDYVQTAFETSTGRIERFERETDIDFEARRRAALELEYFLPGQLDRKDRMTMARGLEVRVPFCQKDLVAYLLNVPAGMKLSGGRTKALLRDALAGTVPDSLRLREKSSYPTTHQQQYVEALSTAVADEVLSPESRLGDLIDRDAVHNARVGVGGAPTARATVWMTRLLSTERWLRRTQAQIAL